MTSASRTQALPRDTPGQTDDQLMGTDMFPHNSLLRRFEAEAIRHDEVRLLLSVSPESSVRDLYGLAAAAASTTV